MLPKQIEQGFSQLLTEILLNFGSGAYEIRTRDLFDANEARYQLRQRPLRCVEHAITQMGALSNRGHLGARSAARSLEIDGSLLGVHLAHQFRVSCIVT